MEPLVALLLHEIAQMQALPLHIPLPEDPRLSALCQAFLRQPDAHAPPGLWAASLYMSLRTFSRFFRKQTGMSFSQWRQRACVVLALARLAAGNSVTQVAIELGYESSAAFFGDVPSGARAGAIFLSGVIAMTAIGGHRGCSDV
ncbi:transcriptional activator FtrA [Serratia fonticola]|uniref:Transcriptional activator FtrA n=1 Tax=Serratia fonticola TaxID=47917 RepID=A0A4U9W9N6_SERFO|nr:transcriptional activator FtrA [Serratia fonticola]